MDAEVASCCDQCDCNEKLLSVQAEYAVKEIAFAVENVEISRVLTVNQKIVYLNVKTKEGQCYCLELTVAGFRIVGWTFDEVIEKVDSPYFETIYPLLDSVSPGYRLTFGETLAGKLAMLQRAEQLPEITDCLDIKTLSMNAGSWEEDAATCSHNGSEHS